MSEQNSKNDEQYNLYTEKIVKNPWNRAKKIIKHAAKAFGGGVVFGVAASVVILLIVPNAMKYFEDDKPAKGNVVFTTDTAVENYTDNETQDDGSLPATSGEIGTIGEGEILTADEWTSLMDDRIRQKLAKYRPGINELDSVNIQLRTQITNFRQSMVVIRTSDDGQTWDYITQKGIFGFVVAEDNSFYYILAPHNQLGNKYLVAYFYDGTTASLEPVSNDKTTNISVLACRKADLADDEGLGIRVASLGNSYMVQQGTMLIAMGDLYGETDMLAYTAASSVRNSIMDTDSYYKIISTDIARNKADCGVFLNTSGEVVGIIITDNDKAPSKVVSAYSISELKPLLERMINGKVTPYVGIQPQTVTAAMKNVYGMPAGIYVYNVEHNSPAYKAGVQSGDVITAINGVPISSGSEFLATIYELEIGEAATFDISKPGKDGYREVDVSIVISTQ